jgi:hypothetical protein
MLLLVLQLVQHVLVDMDLQQIPQHNVKPVLQIVQIVLTQVEHQLVHAQPV